VDYVLYFDWIFASCYWRRYQFETHVVAWTIGAVFVALAVPLSLQDIHMHIIHYISPLQVSGELTFIFITTSNLLPIDGWTHFSTGTAHRDLLRQL